MIKKNKEDQPSLKTLYEYKCSCGKLLQDHDLSNLGTTSGWDRLKMYYDLNTCDIESLKKKGYEIISTPNGFGKFWTYKKRKTS